MLIAPLHVKDYCVDDHNDADLNRIKNMFDNPNAHAYRLQCSCGSRTFYCFTNDHPDLVCDCSGCGKRIVVYDLSEYPAATKTDAVYELQKVNDSPLPVYPVYEYGDDFYDSGADVNDVTWFSAYTVDDGNLRLLLDDETA